MSWCWVKSWVDVADLADESLHVADIVSIDGDLSHLTIELNRLKKNNNKIRSKGKIKGVSVYSVFNSAISSQLHNNTINTIYCNIKYHLPRKQIKLFFRNSLWEGIAFLIDTANHYSMKLYWWDKPAQLPQIPISVKLPVRPNSIKSIAWITARTSTILSLIKTGNANRTGATVKRQWSLIVCGEFIVMINLNVQLPQS